MRVYVSSYTDCAVVYTECNMAMPVASHGYLKELRDSLEREKRGSRRVAESNDATARSKDTGGRKT